MAEGGTTPRAKLHHDRVAFLLLLAALCLGAGIRLFTAVTSFSSTMDTSTVGLMGINILKGEHPLFYYGQSYMGALEGYAVAVMFKIFGISLVTQTFAPIFFTLLWIVAMYLLFAELYGRRAGAVAALCAALPGWHTLWYTLATYGGYPETYFFGTMFVYLSLRYSKTGHRLLCGAALGVLAALGIWTNLQVIPFFVTGTLVLLGHLISSKQRLREFAPLAAAAAIACIGFVPFCLAAWHGENSQSLLMGGMNWHLIKAHTAAFLSHRLPALVFWPSIPSLWLKSVVAAILLGGSALSVFRIAQERNKVKASLPLVFLFVFLLMYLPHPMASIRAVRYSIPFYIMGISFALAPAVGLRALRQQYLALTLVILWLAYNLSGAIVQGIQTIPVKKEQLAIRNNIIQIANQLGVTNVVLVGSPLEGLYTLTYRLYSKGNVNFVACTEERHYSDAVAADQADELNFFCRLDHLPYMRSALHAMNVRNFHETKCGKFVFIHDINIPHVKRRVVHDISADADGRVATELIDRDLATGVESVPGEKFEIIVDLGDDRMIDGFRVVSPDEFALPNTYEVAVSANRETWNTILTVPTRFADSYLAGNKVYFKDADPFTDTYFPPVSARFLRLSVAQRSPEHRLNGVSELFVFEYLADRGPVSESEVQNIASSVQQRNLTFVACDRWMSSQLTNLSSNRNSVSVFPLRNERIPRTMNDRFVRIDSTNGIVVETSFADETLAVLREAGYRPTEINQTNFGHYTLICAAKTDSGDVSPATVRSYGGMVFRGESAQ